MTQYTPYAAVTLIAAGLVVLLGIGVWRHRSGPARLPFVVLMLAVAGWTLAVAGQLTSSTLAAKLLWDKLTYVGIVVVPTAFLVFVLVYANRDERVTTGVLALLCVEPGLTFVTVWTNPAGLYAAESWLVTAGSMTLLEQTYGPWFWANVVYSYLLILAGVALLVELVVRERGLYRRQALSLLGGAFVPWIANAVSILDMGPVPGLDLTPFGFVAMGVVFGWALLRYRLLDLMPLARETVVENLDDGVIVVGPDGRITAVNLAAERLLDVVASAAVGTPVRDLLPAYDELTDRPGGDHEGIALEGPETPHYLDASVSDLTDDDGRVVGELIVLRDVTDRRLREQRLEVLARVLRHNLRNDMNVVLGHTDQLAEAVPDPDRRHAEVVKETARGLVTMSEKAGTVERALRDRTEGRPAEIVAPLERTLAAVADEHPSARIATDLPEAAWVAGGGEVVIAVRELVENAIRHADGPTVRVSVSATDERVSIAVEDDGPGIPEDERAALERGRETPLRHGSGIGIWLVHWIATASGGEVSFAENEPRGSVATIELPAASPPEDP